MSLTEEPPEWLETLNKIFQHEAFYTSGLYSLRVQVDSGAEREGRIEEVLTKSTEGYIVFGTGGLYSIYHNAHDWSADLRDSGDGKNTKVGEVTEVEIIGPDAE